MHPTIPTQTSKSLISLLRSPFSLTPIFYFFSLSFPFFVPLRSIIMALGGALDGRADDCQRTWRSKVKIWSRSRVSGKRIIFRAEDLVCLCQWDVGHYQSCGMLATVPYWAEDFRFKRTEEAYGFYWISESSYLNRKNGWLRLRDYLQARQRKLGGWFIVRGSGISSVARYFLSPIAFVDWTELKEAIKMLGALMDWRTCKMGLLICKGRTIIPTDSPFKSLLNDFHDTILGGHGHSEVLRTYKRLPQIFF